MGIGLSSAADTLCSQVSDWSYLVLSYRWCVFLHRAMDTKTINVLVMYFSEVCGNTV